MKGDKLYLEISLPVAMGPLTINVEAVFGSKIATGISQVTDNGKAAVEGIYSIDGRRLNGMEQGRVNIIRRADGTSVKVLKKH